MKCNHAKSKLAAGELVLAPILGANSIPDLDTLDLVGGEHQFDIAWVEMEHGPWTWGDLTNISRVCELHGLTSLVRVAHNDPGEIGHALDRGMDGVLVPHIDTPEQAEAAVRAALFAPAGTRGMGGARHGWGVTGYVRSANSSIMVVAMLESIEALDNLAEILEVPGVDCFFVAPGDLAQTVGGDSLGNPSSHEVQSLIKQSIRQIVSRGRRAGTVVDEHSVADYVALGATFLRYSAITYLNSGLRTFRATCSALPSSNG